MVTLSCYELVSLGPGKVGVVVIPSLSAEKRPAHGSVAIGVMRPVFIPRFSLPPSLLLIPLVPRALRPFTASITQAWSKPKYRHRSPNVIAMIRNSENITNWVADSILSAQTLKLRREVCLPTKPIPFSLAEMGCTDAFMPPIFFA